MNHSMRLTAQVFVMTLNGLVFFAMAILTRAAEGEAVQTIALVGMGAANALAALKLAARSDE